MKKYFIFSLFIFFINCTQKPEDINLSELKTACDYIDAYKKLLDASNKIKAEKKGEKIGEIELKQLNLLEKKISQVWDSGYKKYTVEEFKKCPGYNILIRENNSKKSIEIKEEETDGIDYDTLIDARDGKVYKTIKIGKQVWMAENLKADVFRNGDTIYEAHLMSNSNKFKNYEFPCTRCWDYYNSDPLIGEKFGKLYSVHTVLNEAGLAPVGWHIPTKSDFEKLIKFLGPKDIALKLKSKYGWEVNSNGNNASGFNALPGGLINYEGDSYSSSDLGSVGYWWTSDWELYPVVDLIWIFKISGKDNECAIDATYHFNWLYVRCIKD